MDLYKQDGVDIEAGDVFSRFCAAINKSTYEISKYVQINDLSQGNFRGPRGFNFINLPDGCLQTGGMDGIGTKVVVIEATGDLKTTATNIIAMTAMDITRWGGLPLLFMNTLDVSSLGETDSETFAMCKDIMSGLQEVALKEKYVLFNGETAELGPCISSENLDARVMFNWCGAMFGVYHPEKMILGNTLRPGQVIIALKDSFRSNGISSVRKALAIKYGKEWWNNPEAMDDIIECSTGSASYDRMLNEAHGWFSNDPFTSEFNMHLIVHLSGGAFESKLGDDILKPMGLSAVLDYLFDPPEIMQKCVDWRGMRQKECYGTWNGGQGAIVVVDAEDADSFINFSKERGVEAKKAGKIIEKGSFTVFIRSKFGDKKSLYY